MNTISREVRYLGAIDCFVYRGGSYIPSNSSVERKLSQSLPTVSSKYEQLLIDNNIAYNKLEGDECEIYDKDCYEFEELTLPVYVYHAIKGVYIHTGKEHTEQVITKESLTAASRVEHEVENLIQIANIKEAAEKVKALLSKNAIAFVPCSSPIIPELRQFQFELCEKNRYFISQRRSKGGYGSCFGYVIVDLKAAEGKSVLDMDVPEAFVGLIIGARAQNLTDLISDINELKPVHISWINVLKIAS